MAKDIIVKGEVLKSLLRTFSSGEEFEEFTSMFAATSLDYLACCRELAIIEQKEESEVEYAQYTAKGIFLIAVFCRANIDIIQELVKKVDYEQVEFNG